MKKVYCCFILVSIFLCGAVMWNGWNVEAAKLGSEKELVIPSVDEILRNGYPTNDRGETYGPDISGYLLSLSETDYCSALPPDMILDLILAKNDEGVVGYVKRKDVLVAAKSIEEALAESGKSPETVPMYLQDGVTRIGTFSGN